MSLRNLNSLLIIEEFRHRNEKQHIMEHFTFHQNQVYDKTVQPCGDVINTLRTKQMPTKTNELKWDSDLWQEENKNVFLGGGDGGAGGFKSEAKQTKIVKPSSTRLLLPLTRKKVPQLEMCV